MSNPNQTFEVLLIAGIDAIGLARFPHILHKAHCRVTVASPPGLAIMSSRYVAHHIPISADPKARALQIKELLSAPQAAYKLVIIGDEPTLIALSDYCGQACLDGWFPVDHRDQEKMAIVLSKWAFQQAAINIGLYTPLAKMCHDWDSVVAATEDIGYPVMLKSFSGLSGSGVRKVHNADELEDAHLGLTGGDQSVLVQRFYEGQLGSIDVLFDHGVPVCWQSSYSLNCWPTPLAASSARAIMDHPDVAKIVAGVGQITGFHGFAGIDWIQDHKSGHLYVLELNPRITPSYHLAKYSAVDFSHSLHQLLLGLAPITPPQPGQHAGHLVRMFPQGLYWAISRRDVPDFLHCWADAPWHDPLLIAAYGRRVLTHFLPTHWRVWVKRLLRR